MGQSRHKFIYYLGQLHPNKKKIQIEEYDKFHTISKQDSQELLEI